MSEPVVWGELAKSQVDPATIDEGIADALSVHNADPEAHMDSLASLEIHRTSAIVDHLAESVVNDKLKPNARNWVAVVDPTSPSDFDTLEAAILYADPIGGGNILLMPGQHYLSAVTDLPTNCNLYGVDPDTTVLEVGETAHGYIKIVESTYSNQTNTVISNLQFHANTAKALELDLLGGASQHTVYLDNCTFSGQAGYVFGVVDKLVMTDCTLEMGTDYAVGIAGYLVVRDCNFTREDDTVRRLAIRSNLYDPEVFSLRLIDTTIVGNGASGYPVVHFDEAEELYCTGTKIFGNYNTTISREGGYFSGNLFTFLASRYLTIDGAENLFIGNRITGSVTNILRLSSASTENIVSSNVARGGILDSGTDNQVGINIS